MNRYMTKLKRVICALMAVCLVCASGCMGAFDSHAALVNIQGNDYFGQNSIPSGKTGKNMSVTFTFTADRDYDKVWIGINYDDVVNSSDDKEDPDTYAFPFEVSEESLKPKSIGSVKSGQTKSVSISAKVRRDIPEGYYGVMVYAASGDNGTDRIAEEYVNVWVKKSTTTDDKEDDEVKAVTFVVGEGQSTPYGTYPNVMNFSLNLRNRGKITAQDATVSIVLDADKEKFPFDINDANYDRHFDKISYDETVSLDYSFAIRKDTYTGYYPIKLKITYRESQDGDLKEAESEFYVHVVNKDKEDDLKEFNANDRTKARIIVDSYYTEPAEVYAGQEFDLVVVMKNASSSVNASNLLFTFVPEKVSDSAVFSTSNGSDSIVVNSLSSNQTTELRMKFIAKAGIDQRSYSMSIKEKYDSPEFKNAEEQVDIDIPVKQVARLNTGTIDIMPDTINIDDESNVMFPINNTGKVILYNVMAKFEADSIVTNEAYVGNIKPGETGNVDIMLKGAAATADDGKVKITISYEDDNGNVSTVDKELTLYVSEPVEESEDFNMDTEGMGEETAKPWYTNIIFIVIGLAIIAIIAALIIRKRHKKKEEIKELDGVDDET